MNTMNNLIETVRSNAEEWKNFEWNKKSLEKTNLALGDGKPIELIDSQLRQEADWAHEAAPKLGVDLDKEDYNRKRNEFLDTVESGYARLGDMPDAEASFDNRCKREGAYKEWTQLPPDKQADHVANWMVMTEFGQGYCDSWSKREVLYDKYGVKNDDGLVEVCKNMVAERKKMRGSWERAYDGIVKGVAKSGDIEASLAGVKAQGGDSMDYEAALDIGVNRGKLYYLQEAQQKLKPIMDKMDAKQKEQEENPMGTPILDKEDWLKVGGAQDALVDLLYANKDDKERFTALMDLMPEMMPEDKRWWSQQFTKDVATSFKGAAEVAAGKDNKYVAIRRAALETERGKRDVPQSWLGRGIRSTFDQAAQMTPIVATGMITSAATGGNLLAGIAAGAAVGASVYGAESIMNAYADGGSKWASIGYGAGIGALQGGGDMALVGVSGLIGKVGKTAAGASVKSGAKAVSKSGIGRAGGVVARAVTGDSAGSAAGFYARKMAWNSGKSIGFEHVQENGEDMTGVLLENTMRKCGAQLPVQQTFVGVWEQNSFKNPEYAVPVILLGGGMGFSGGMREAFFADRASRSKEMLEAHSVHPMIAQEIANMPDGPGRERLLGEVEAKVDLGKAQEALPAAFALTADNLNFLRESSRVSDFKDNLDGTFSYTDAFTGQTETFDKGMFPSIMEGFMRSEEGLAIMTAQLYARGKEVAEFEGYKWQVVDQGVLDQYMKVGSEVAKNRTLAYIASDPELKAKYDRGEITIDDVMKDLEIVAVTDKGVIQIAEGKANFAEIAEELCHARVNFDTKVGKVSDEFIIQGLKDWEEFTGESVGDVTDYVQRNEAVARLAVAAATDPSILNKLPPRMNGFIVWLKSIIADVGRVFQTGEKLRQGVKSGAISEEFYGQLKEWGALESRKVEQGVVESVTGESYDGHLAALRTKGRPAVFSSYDDSGLFDATNFPKDHKLGHDEWVKNGRLLATNGRPSNLTADEYAMVYSPEFKKENGDWESFSKGEFLRGEPIAELSGDEFAKSADDSRPLSVKVADFYKENGVDSVHVPGLGDVDLGLNTIENALNHWMNRQKAAAFVSVPDVLVKGVHLDSRVQTGNDNLVSHVFAAPVKINGENYVEVVRIRQAKGQAGKFYLHGVQLLEKLENKKSSETIIDQSKHEAGLTGGPEDIFNLVKGALAVNKNDVHVDIDGNGEPSLTGESPLAAIRRRKFNETSKGLDESPRYSTYKSMIQAAVEQNPTKVFESLTKSLNDLETADKGSAKALNRKKDVVLTIDRTLRVLGDGGLSKAESNKIVQAKDNAALGRALDAANLRLSVALSEARANAEAADFEARLAKVHEKQIEWEKDQDRKERKEYSATWRKLLVAKERDDLKEKRRERKEARELTAREKADEKAREDAIKKQKKADAAELKKNIGKMGELAKSVYNGRKQRSRTFDADTRRLGMYAETLMDMNPDDVAAMKEDLNGRFAELEKEGETDPAVKEQMDSLRLELAMVEEYGGVLYKEKGKNGRWKYLATPEAIKHAQKSLIELLEVGRVRWAVAEMQRLEPIRQIKAELHEAAGGDRSASEKQEMERKLAKKGYRSLWEPICNFLQSPIQFLDTYVESNKLVPEGLRNFARALREIVADASNMTAEAEKVMKEKVGNVLKGAMEIAGKKPSLRGGAKYVNDLEVANIKFAGAMYSKGALIDVYMTSLEKDGVSTLKDSNGITAEQIETLPELIGEDGVYIATELFKIYKELGIDVKAVYEAHSGHPLFMEDNYVPRDRDFSKMSREAALGLESGQSAVGKPDALKDRTKSKAALIFSDSPIKKLLKHSGRMNSYMARVKLIDIYNNVLRNKDSSFDLRVMMGDQDFNALKKGVENMLLDGNKLAQEAELVSRFGNFMNVFAKSALGYSINPIIRNVAAVVNPLIGTDFTSNEIARALADLKGGQFEGFTFKDVLEIPSIKVRFNNDLKTEALFKMAAKVEFKQASSLSFFSDIGMVGIEKTDLWVTIPSVWLAAQVLKKRGLSKEMITKELNLNVLRSSQPMRVETKPMGMAGMNRLASNNFMFMSDIMNKAGLFTSYLQQGKYGMSTATYLTVGLVNMVTSEVISTLFGRDDEPDMTPEGIAASIVLAPLLDCPFTAGVAELVMKKAGIPVWSSGNKVVDTSKAIQKISSVFEKATDDKDHSGESWGYDLIGLAKALSVPAGGMLSMANRGERAAEVFTLMAQGSNTARGIMRGGHRLQSATGMLSELGKKEQDYSKEKKAMKEAVSKYGKDSPQARVARMKANLIKRQVDAMKKQK